MEGTVTGFVLGWLIILVQAAIAGLLAYWSASRISRLWRIIGGVVITILIVWPSIVVIINRATGHDLTSPLDTNIAILVGVGVGWMMGKARRLRAAPVGVCLTVKEPAP
jgi:hypothetical protein